MPVKKKKVKKSSRRPKNPPGLLAANHPLTPYIEHPRFGIIDRLRSDVLAAVNEAGSISGGLRTYNQWMSEQSYARVSAPMWKRWTTFLNVSRRSTFSVNPLNQALAAEPTTQSQPQFAPEPAPPTDINTTSMPATLFDGLDGTPDRTPVYVTGGLGGVNNNTVLS